MNRIDAKIHDIIGLDRSEFHLEAMKILSELHKSHPTDPKVLAAVAEVFQRRVNQLMREGRINEAILTNNEHLLWDPNDLVAKIRKKQFACLNG